MTLAKLSPEQKRKVVELVRAGYVQCEIAQRYGVSPAVIHEACKQAQEPEQAP